MENRELVNFLSGRFFMISERLIHAVGVERALWITNLFGWRGHLIGSSKISEDDFFYLTQSLVTEKTDISVDKQTAFIKYFQEAEVLEVRRGNVLPAKNFYRIDAVKLIELVERNMVEYDQRKKEKQEQKKLKEENNQSDGDLAKTSVCKTQTLVPSTKPTTEKLPTVPVKHSININNIDNDKHILISFKDKSLKSIPSQLCE